MAGRPPTLPYYGPDIAERFRRSERERMARMQEAGQRAEVPSEAEGAPEPQRRLTVEQLNPRERLPIGRDPNVLEAVGPPETVLTDIINALRSGQDFGRLMERYLDEFYTARGDVQYLEFGPEGAIEEIMTTINDER